MNESKRLTPYAGLLVAIIGISFAAIFIRWSESSALVIATYRMAFATIILLPFALTYAREEVMGLKKKDVGYLVLIGGLLAVHFVAFIASLDLTSVASSTILVTSHPLMVGLIGYWVLKEGRSSTGAGLVLGFLGVVLISLGDLSGQTFAGDMLAILGAVMAGAYILMGRVFRKRISLITYVFLVYLSCTIVLLVASVFSGEALWPVPQQEILLFLALAVVSTILGHTLFNWSLRYVSAALVSISFMGEPVGATILAFFLLSENPPVTAIIGGAMVLLGITLTAKLERKIRLPRS